MDLALVLWTRQFERESLRGAAVIVSVSFPFSPVCSYFSVLTGGATSFHGERTFELEEILYGETENNLNLLQRRALERGRTTGRSIWLTDFHIDPFYLTSERHLASPKRHGA